MKDDPIKTCPECSGAVKRLLYPVGIVFKGSGWYINDSRKPDTSDMPDKQTDKSDKAETSDGVKKGVKTSDGDKSGGESKSESVAAEASTPEKKSA